MTLAERMRISLKLVQASEQTPFNFTLTPADARELGLLNFRGVPVYVGRNAKQSVLWGAKPGVRCPFPL